MSSAFVVGSSGFLGTAVEQYLRAQKKQVHSVNRGNPLLSLDQFRRSAEHGHPIVLWLASSVTPASAESKRDSCESDYSYFESVVTWLSRYAPNSRVILASSGGAIYDNVAPPFSEISPVSRTLAYSRLKLDMENLLLESGLSCAILRVANAYGPGQRVGRGQGVLAEWLNSIYLEEPLKVFGTLEASRDFVHVEDVARAFVTAAYSRDAYGLFNIGSGTPTKLVECISLLEEIIGRTISVDLFGSRNVDRLSVYLDITRAREILKWSPRISLKEGLIGWWKLLSDSKD